MKKKIYIIFLLSQMFLIAYSPVYAQSQSPELVSKFFQDPDVKINTPGFMKTEGFMNYLEMMNFLISLENKRNDILSIRYCGESISGKKIPVVYLGKGQNSSKVKIWMQGGLHGNEPAGTEGILMFIDHLINSSNIDSILNYVSFAFIPMANIDGYEKQVRDNENQADLNRDQVTLLQKESVFLKQAFTDYSPAVALDFHEYRPFRKELEKYSTKKLCISQDVLFLPSGNLNIPYQLREITNELYLRNVKDILKQNKLSFDNYFVPDLKADGTGLLRMGGDSPRSSSTSYGLTNAVSILFEIRGIGLGKDSYKRRVYSGFLIASSILETTLKNREEVIKTVEASVKETVNRKSFIILNSAPSVYEKSEVFIDVENLSQAQINVQIEDAGQSKAVSFRKRPKAYLLTAGNNEIARKLLVLGLKIDTLKKDMNLQIEVFKIESNTQNPGMPSDTVFSISRQNRIFPKGSFVISTAQKNANMAIVTLEPEMENGYYKYKMIKTNADGEIPVYRCLTDAIK
jgi:hypothetical protein